MSSNNTHVTELTALLPHALAAAAAGAEETLTVYREGNLETESKEDDTPLTRADRNAHAVILERLSASGLPALSEEGHHAAYAERSAWDRFWLVDPLDGTKEFVKRTEEFTVNVALVQAGVPVLGVVVLPALGTVYFGTAADGAYRLSTAELTRWLEAAEPSRNALPEAAARIAAEPAPQAATAVCRVVGSRSHMDDTTQAFIDALRKQYADVELVVAGSSAKLCRVADGSAHIYPRFGPTMEWDTAAGDAVVRAAGGHVYEARSDGSVTAQPLRYNKEDLHNPSFVARG
jgi:3'(2'), 5'-bisphosphate nucleotidase